MHRRETVSGNHALCSQRHLNHVAPSHATETYVSEHSNACGGGFWLQAHSEAEENFSSYYLPAPFKSYAYWWSFVFAYFAGDKRYAFSTHRISVVVVSMSQNKHQQRSMCCPVSWDLGAFVHCFCHHIMLTLLRFFP